MKMTYQEYRHQRQEEFNNLPIFYAFSKEQFESEMEKRGLTAEDTDKIYSLPGGAGGYCLRSDVEQIKAFMKKPDPIKELMQDDEFAESAFYYEMSNHEYHINWQGDWDVCSCFGNCEYGEDKDYSDYLHEMGYSDKVIQAFKRAKSRFWKCCEENDMF